MTIGWEFLGDLTHIDDKEKIRSKMQAEYSDSSSHMNRVLACYNFSHTIKPGDFIFSKKGKSQLLGYGKVQSDYLFDDNRAEHKHVRKVDWVKKGVLDAYSGSILDADWHIGSPSRLKWRKSNENTDGLRPNLGQLPLSR